MNKHKIIEAFKVEDLRARLAEESKYLELKKTYSPIYPEINDENTSLLWDKLNIDFEQVDNKNPMAIDRLKSVARILKKHKLQKILNIGFGSASLEKIALSNTDNKYIWYGIDISPKSVAHAKRVIPKGKFKVQDLTKGIASKNNHYDCVIALEVLEHIRPILTFKVLSEIFRVLKPNGKFIISIPLNEGLEHMILRGENPNAHVRVYAPNLIKAELRIAGFQILEEKLLYAFNDFYSIKTLFANYLLPGIRNPNNLLLISQKADNKKSP